MALIGRELLALLADLARGLHGHLPTRGVRRAARQS
jgi:hypothetical protein